MQARSAILQCGELCPSRNQRNGRCSVNGSESAYWLTTSLKAGGVRRLQGYSPSACRLYDPPASLICSWEPCALKQKKKNVRQRTSPRERRCVCLSEVPREYAGSCSCAHDRWSAQLKVIKMRESLRNWQPHPGFPRIFFKK